MHDQHVVRGVGREPVEGDGSPFHGATLIEPCELQQVADQVAHPGRFLLGATHRLVELSGASESAVAVELAVAADGGDRGAQLV